MQVVLQGSAHSASLRNTISVAHGRQYTDVRMILNDFKNWIPISI